MSIAPVTSDPVVYVVTLTVEHYDSLKSFPVAFLIEMAMSARVISSSQIFISAVGVVDRL